MTDQDAVFKAIADPTRRLLLQELAARDQQSLFELVVRLIDLHGLSITRQGISKHLSLLESAGLIEAEWQGKTKLHRLNRKPLDDVCRPWLDSMIRDGGEEVEQ
ncbi:helix-turn-helix domain-containing protein [bacterium]|nr:helix-turn-helix domain-containing protein [bacterium]